MRERWGRVSRQTAHSHREIGTEARGRERLGAAGGGYRYERLGSPIREGAKMCRKGREMAKDIEDAMRDCTESEKSGGESGAIRAKIGIQFGA
jgi:hypothetical protein